MPETLTSPTEPPLKQQQIHHHSCGPCSLVHSFAHASISWRKKPLFLSLQNEQVELIITQFGKKTSSLSFQKARWNPRRGMNATDLYRTAQELSPRKLKNLATSKNLSLTNYHTALQKSLTLGFPPIFSVKQQIHKKFNSQPRYYWTKTKGHFISLLSLGPLSDDGSSFQITYIDSFDGNKHTGTLISKTESFLTTSPLTRQPFIWKPIYLQADLPNLKISIKDMQKGSKVTTEIDTIILAH